MKKKIILICLLGIAATIFIYYTTINNKVKLLTLGDGLASGMTAYNVSGYSYSDYLKDYYKKQNHLQYYNNSFAEANKNTYQLLTELKANKSININGKKVTLQQAIKEANVIILAIGLDELANKSLDAKITVKELNSYYSRVEEILTFIKKINHEKIIIIGLYPAYNLTEVSKINNQLKKLANKMKCNFLDISSVVNKEEYYFNDTSYYINYKGHKKISEELIKLI